ncbi:MAG: WD40 repeat domain-containing protein, partial [Promethearchaeota archaeon]
MQLLNFSYLSHWIILVFVIPCGILPCGMITRYIQNQPVSSDIQKINQQFDEKYLFGDEIIKLPNPDQDSDGINTIAFSPNNTILASCDNRNIVIWDIITQEDRTLNVSPLGKFRSIAFSSDGSTLAIAENTCTLLIDINTEVIRNISSGSSSVAFSPDGVNLAIGASDIKVYNVFDGNFHPYYFSIRTQRDPFIYQYGLYTSVDFSPNGSFIVAHHTEYYFDGMNSTIVSFESVELWDLRTNKLFLTRSDHSGSIYSVSFSPVEL